VSIILKKLSWPDFDIISFGYDHIPKSVACAFLALPFFTAGLFLHGIIVYSKIVDEHIYHAFRKSF